MTDKTDAEARLNVYIKEDNGRVVMFVSVDGWEIPRTFDPGSFDEKWARLIRDQINKSWRPWWRFGRR